MDVLLNVILPVFLAAGAAALVQPTLKLDERALSRVTFYIFSPALAFHALATSGVSGGEFAQIAAVEVGVTLILWAVGAMIAPALKLEGGTRGAFLVGLVLMNTANYGFPANQFAFGEAGLARAVLYYIVSTLLRSSLCIYLVARSRQSIRESLRSVITVPVLYTAVAGLLVNLTGVRVPDFILRATAILGQGSVPALMMVLGIQLYRVAKSAVQGARDHWRLPALAALVAGRLLLSPLLAWLLSIAFGVTGLTRDVVILESAMPAAVMTLVLTMEYDADTEFAALSVFVTTIASLLTVTVILNLLM
jgi:malate permease and related proteins